MVPIPKNHPTIWVFRNKIDDSGIVVRNKARLVSQVYSQEKGINYEEIYVPIVRLEVLRILLAFTCHKNFKLFQMNVKSSF